MTTNEKIRERRLLCGMSQEQLAQALGVTMQAVSKWECSQNLPDITLFPTLADVLDTSLDYLLRDEVPLGASPAAAFPDDGTLRVVQFLGQTMLSADGAASGEPGVDVRLCIEDVPGKTVSVAVQAPCPVTIRGHIGGDLSANGDVTGCGSVGGNVYANGDVTCGSVCGDVSATGDVSCGSVGGDVQAASVPRNG